VGTVSDSPAPVAQADTSALEAKVDALTQQVSVLTQFIQSKLPDNDSMNQMMENQKALAEKVNGSVGKLMTSYPQLEVKLLKS